MYSKSIGGVSWIDLTVEDATKVKDFYKSVIGFDVESISMGEYNDYVMKSPDEPNSQVGVCHARGSNSNIPPQWLVYFNVSDVDEAAQKCIASGGRVIKEKCDMGDFYMCIIKDPAGAIAALVAKK